MSRLNGRQLGKTRQVSLFTDKGSCIVPVGAFVFALLKTESQRKHQEFRVLCAYTSPLLPAKSNMAEPSFSSVGITYEQFFFLEEMTI